jgi:hypothetical protein
MIIGFIHIVETYAHDFYVAIDKCIKTEQDKNYEVEIQYSTTYHKTRDCIFYSALLITRNHK